jgi:hypothetical protein
MAMDDETASACSSTDTTTKYARETLQNYKEAFLFKRTVASAVAAPDFQQQQRRHKQVLHEYLLNNPAISLYAFKFPTNNTYKPMFFFNNAAGAAVAAAPPHDHANDLKDAIQRVWMHALDVRQAALPPMSLQKLHLYSHANK